MGTYDKEVMQLYSSICNGTIDYESPDNRWWRALWKKCDYPTNHDKLYGEYLLVAQEVLEEQA
jgi:hypothetical protein